MPIARIVTRSPQRAAALRKTLIDSGYHVDVVRPEDAVGGVADIQYDLDEMPEYAGQPDAPAEREFIFAPQWRALLSRFGKTEKPAPEIRAQKPVEPSVSYARLEERSATEPAAKPAKGPGLLERVQAMRGPLSKKLDRARQDFDRKRQQLAQQTAERRAAAEESRRVREAEFAKQSAADHLAAERARAEAAVRLQQEQAAQQAREARRRAEVAAQMELRRQEQERAAQIAREAARETAPAPEPAAPVADVPATPVERRHGLGEALTAAFHDLRDWRRTYASTRFPTTRSYAFRQYTPVAAGVALAFFLGWAIAVGGARKTAASAPPVRTEQVTAAPVPAAVIAPPTAPARKPSAAPQKASAARPKAPVRRFRRPSQDDEVVWKDGAGGADDDVTVIHHYPGKSSLARSGKKNGVKTISDLEQN